MSLLNPELLKFARAGAAGVDWTAPGALEKLADPGMAAPPGMGAPPGGDPAAAGGGPPAGPMDPAMQQQIVQTVQQAMAAGGGGAGGAAGKGKNPKEQIQSSLFKIMIHLQAQIAQKLGIQVDPMLLVPPSDAVGEQAAMQEMQSTPMVPGAGGDPAAAGGMQPAAPQPGVDPAAAGGAGMPAPMQPMDPGAGPIGKAAAAPWLLGAPYSLDDALGGLRATRNKAAAYRSMYAALGGLPRGRQ